MLLTECYCLTAHCHLLKLAFTWFVVCTGFTAGQVFFRLCTSFLSDLKNALLHIVFFTSKHTWYCTMCCCFFGVCSCAGGKEPAAGKKQDVMNALLHSPCYETQLATLDYYSSVCAMFTRKNAISCGSGGGDDSCRGAGRNDDEVWH